MKVQYEVSFNDWKEAGQFEVATHDAGAPSYRDHITRPVLFLLSGVVLVPTCSVIYKVFTGETVEAEAVEDLAWWSTRDGKALSPRKVRVRARRFEIGRAH